MNSADVPAGAPRTWLDGLAAHLRATLANAEIQGAISGPGWLSVRVGGRFLWFFVHGADRMVWVSAQPLPGRHLKLLGRHARSPFPPHLGGRRLDDARVLVTAEGTADGLDLVLGPAPAHHLRVRFFPKPGAIWVTTATGEDLARQGRMEGEELVFRPSSDATTGEAFDPEAHTVACEAALEERLRRQTARVLRQRTDQARKRAQRRVWQLEGDLREAESDQNVRATADLLAAHLHEIEPGRDKVDLVDFDGNPVRVELDPSRPPHTNLERWYKRAARSERKIEQVATRLDDARIELAATTVRYDAVRALDDETSLTTWLELADTHGLDPAPNAPKPASARGRPDADRLPYWPYVIGDWELRVGRSARDNDALIKGHAHGRDLWLHAQGVPGSHVIVRSGGKPVPRAIVESAARLAAHFSRSKTSATVPVLVVERRHVRKPRKAAPGEVIADRAKTVFVEPGIPKGCVRADDDA